VIEAIGLEHVYGVTRGDFFAHGEAPWRPNPWQGVTLT
jgi:hypothetical protein